MFKEFKNTIFLNKGICAINSVVVLESFDNYQQGMTIYFKVFNWEDLLLVEMFE